MLSTQTDQSWPSSTLVGTVIEILYEDHDEEGGQRYWPVKVISFDAESGMFSVR